MRLVRLFGLVMVLVTFSVSAWAAGLSGSQVEGFVNSMKDLKPYFDQYADEVGDDGDATSTAQIVKDWASGLKEQREVMGILKKHGFDQNSWADVSQLVMRAYMAIKFGEEGRNVPAQMAESLKEIEANPDIPAEQKAEIRASMQKGIEEFEQNMDAPEEDQDSVRPYLDQLDAIFEWQE
jgi:uncharacterized protein YecA (UPF0149 family)